MHSVVGSLSIRHHAHWRTLGFATLLASLLITSGAVAQEPASAPLIQAQRAAVYLMQTYTLAGTQTISCVGSGTLIGADGLILTNAHLVQASGPCRGERIIVALPIRLNEPPVPTYLAQLIQADETHDLAILQIFGGLDGSAISPESLNLPFVTISDPSGLLPGNTLTFVGFPDAGSGSVTSIEGQITGITTEKSGSRFAWFRTNIELAGGMSGGGAYDANGQLVGIPTSAPATAGISPGAMCLSIQDNNHDGLINERDACVPIGGAVTAVRPVSFAAPLIEAARNGLTLSHKEGLPTAPVSGDPELKRLFFSTNVDPEGTPTRIVSSLASGPTSLFLFFDYESVQPGTPYELQVSRNGAAVPGFSLGPLAWMGDQKGMWHIGTENLTWPDGEYDFTLLLNGEIASSASITIGSVGGEATFSGLTFSSGDGNENTTTGNLLPAGIPQIDARFDFENMVDGQEWREIWYLDGTPISDLTRIWDQGASGQAVVHAINYGGLPLGSYRLELFIGSRLAATGDVTLAGNMGSQNQAAVFSNARLASDITREGAPGGQIVQSGAVFPLGVTDLYTFVNWDFMPGNLSWTYRWFLDGRLVASSTQPWTAGGVGRDYWVRLHGNGPLPEGLYAVEVLVENRPMFSANVAVGSGTQPQPGREESDDVFVSGRVADALTGKGIPGALIVVLEEQFESPDFTWDESQIHTQAITDREGRFVLLRGLPRGPLGSFYTVFVFAEGYLTLVEDTFWVLQAYEQQIDIEIEMNRP